MNFAKEAVSTGKHALKAGALFYGMNKAFSAVNQVAHNYLGDKLPAQAVTAIAGLGLAVATKAAFKSKMAHEAADFAAIAAVVTILQSTAVINSNVDAALAPVMSIGLPAGTTQGYFRSTKGYSAAKPVMSPQMPVMGSLRQSGMRGLTSKHFA